MYKKETLELHKKLGGKLEIKSKVPLNIKTLNLAYTPGVAEVSKKIFKNKKSAYDYTIKKNTVAVVSDGSAVLGLGNIGAEAALPVMEGKAILFKELADIDAFPICLKTQDAKEIIKIVKNIAPNFGGINLEDIAAPKCFEVEDELQNLGIPVMHDDQHGTAVVVYAGLINACKVLNKSLKKLKIIINGAGAAGTAIAKALHAKDIIVCDSKGAIYKGRKHNNPAKESLALITNKQNFKGDLTNALIGADIFIGVSAGNLLSETDIKKMAKEPIIFALANPIPEIMPSTAFKAGAAIVATGRSDFPNQINNVLAFPGIFRGALDSKAKKITNKMKLYAAHALANSIKKPTKNNILPLPLDKTVVKNIAKAVASNYN